MIDAMPRRARRRLHLTILVVVCLLFQQLAVAAYLCPAERAAAMPAAPAGCADMQMDVSDHGSDDVPALCAKHCDPDRYLANDGGKLSVPPIALPPPPFAPMPAHDAAHRPALAGVAPVRPDPPPRLRFCSLLI
jgi:hypothetical protein